MNDLVIPLGIVKSTNSLHVEDRMIDLVNEAGLSCRFFTFRSPGHMHSWYTFAKHDIKGCPNEMAP